MIVGQAAQLQQSSEIDLRLRQIKQKDYWVNTIYICKIISTFKKKESTE